MPFANSNGIRLAYERSGSGEPVLMIMGSSAAGRVWTTYQTPALHKAGYETITFDNRGIPPSDVPPGKYTLADLVADTAGLIEELGIGPCHIVGTSMGAMIAEELAARSPHLVRCAVLIATRGREDVFRRALATSQHALLDSGAQVPPSYTATRSVLEMLSPATLRDDAMVSSWLEIFELAGGAESGGQAWIDPIGDRRPTLRTIPAPCRVIAFADDVVCPPHLCAEVADCIPDCDYVEVRDCGHMGYLERPEEVNLALIEFLDKH
jgi:pimeloyl-ACP methyl ester carboxylesterase